MSNFKTAKGIALGNYIYDDDGIVSMVNSIIPHDDSIRADEDSGCQLGIDLHPASGGIKKGYICDLQECSPIPITQDWLIRLGFERVAHPSKKSFVWVKKYFMFLECTWHVKYKRDGFVSFVVKGLFLKECRSVHDLQNLYFALTREHLVIIKQ